MSVCTSSKIQVGDTFGTLTVVFAGQKPRYDRVRCECGYEFTRSRYRLIEGERPGQTQTCRHCKARGAPLTEEQSQLAAKYFKQARNLAYKIAGPNGRHTQDAESAAMLGLLKAVRDYDPRRGNTLSQYIMFTVCNEVLDELKAIKRKEAKRDDLVTRVADRSRGWF